MTFAPPFNLKAWIDEHRELLKPPVGNQVVWRDSEFIVMVVGGPNSRTDFHIDESEEFFYQLEGDVVLRVLEEGRPKDVPLREGDVFLLPARVPHSPQRPANTVGLVIERTRKAHELDGFLWICPKCDDKLYEEFLHVSDIVTQLPQVFARFYGNEAHCSCRRCGHKVER